MNLKDIQFVETCNIDKFIELHKTRVIPGFYIYMGSGASILQEVMCPTAFRVTTVGSSPSQGSTDIESFLWTFSLGENIDGSAKSE
jgi:hypothetical protein